MDTLWKGMVLGLSIAAPVGPIGLLVIRRSMDAGRWAGLACGLGAATADLLYAIIAAYGITLGQAAGRWAAIAGGIFLLVVSWRTWHAKARVEASGDGFVSTFVLTTTNPTTIVMFAAMFAGIGATGLAAAPLAAGVFSGSLAWWFLLSSCAAWIAQRVGSGSLVWINKASAMILFAFGLGSLWRAL